jgi:hypothetical protein
MTYRKKSQQDQNKGWKVRKVVFIILASSLLMLPTSNSYASKKSLGSPCPKASATAQIGEELAICTRIGKSLTWQVNTFAQYVAQWKDVKKIKMSKPEPTVALQVIYSPTVDKALSKKILTALTDASRFWQDRYLPKKAMPVLFLTEKDKVWYLKTLTSIGQYQQELDLQTLNFDDEVAHNGNKANMAGLAGRPDNSYFQFYVGTGTKGSNLYSVQVGAHEYTHAGQFGFSDPSISEFAPCWLIEGGAVFYGGILAAESTSDLRFFRNTDVWSKQRLNFSGLSFEPKAGWPNFINQNGSRSTNPNYEATCGINGTYQVGSIATSYLYSLKGNQGILNFLDLSASRGDYKLAAVEVYGVTWNSLVESIAKYIRLVVAQTPFVNVN